MKILLFTLEYPPFFGGVANYYGNLVGNWPSSAEAAGGKPDGMFVLNNNDGKLICDKLPFLKWLPAFFALSRKVKKEKIGHVFVGHILPLGTVAYFYFKLTKTPYSVFLHGMDLNYALKTARKRKIAKKVLDNAKNVICANSYTAKTVEGLIGDKNKISVVNPGVDSRLNIDAEIVAQIKGKYDLHNKFVLLSIGRLVRRKGFDKVIEALPEVLKIFPNLIYVIIGKGEDGDYLKEKAKEFGDKIIFLDSVTEEEKWAWLDICDVFAMPARDINGDMEGFGIVYLEANLCGKPVIAGDSGGVRDAVQHEVNGLLVNPEKNKEISDAIMRLLLNNNFRMKLGKYGREKVLKDFRWSEKVNKIYNLF